MAFMRKILARSNHGNLMVIEEPVPELQNGEILVEVEVSVISPGTELGKLKREKPDTSQIEKWKGFGYQNAGRVIQLGPNTAGFTVGQRVACMGSSYAVHGTYAVVPVNMAVPIPDNVEFEEAAFIALAATALQAVRRAELQLGESALVMGLGLVGQFVGQLAQFSGAHVLGVDRFPLRINTARKIGAIEQVIGVDVSLNEAAAQISRDYGLDCAFICFGGDATEAFKQAVAAMKRSPDTHVNGRVVIVGGATVEHRFGSSLGNLDIRSSSRTGPGYHDERYERGENYPRVFVPWDTQRNLAEIMGWLSTGKLKARDLISHRSPLEQAPEICRTIIEEPDKTLGVVLNMRNA